MRKTIGARELAFEVGGEGPALLLLHPFPFDRQLWDDVLPALRARHRVIALDFRGFGEAAPSGPYALTDLADDSAALLDALGIPMAAVCGISMGGYVALAFAARHAARLAALALVDTRAVADTPEGRRARDQGMAEVRARGSAAYAASIPDNLLAKRAAAPVRERVRALASSQSSEAIAHALAAMRDRPDRSGELAQITCPTLVVVGAEDPLTPPADARAMARAISGSRLAELPGAGHLTPVEVPGPFAAALLTFLDESL